MEGDSGLKFDKIKFCLLKNFGNRFGGCFEFEVLQQLVTKNTVQAKLVYKDPEDVKTLKSSAT